MLPRFKEVRARIQQSNREGKTRYQGYLEAPREYGPIKIPGGPWRSEKGLAWQDAQLAEHRHEQQQAQMQNPP